MARPKTSNKARPPKGPSKVDRKDASIAKMNTWEDTLDSGEDEFDLNRDRVLLNDTSNKASRAPASDDEFDDEDEVFALQDDQDDDDDEDAYAEEEAAGPKAKKQRKPKEAPSTDPKGRYAKGSDDEGAFDSDASDADDQGSDEEEETWGTNAAAYYARPSTRRAKEDDEEEGDSDLEERRELEDQEARKLQRKMREQMSGADFGLGDLPQVGESDEDEDEAAIAARATAPTEPIPTDTPSLLRHLERTAPETLALAREWGDIADQVPKTAAAIKLAQQDLGEDHPAIGPMMLQYQTLLTYATTVAFYLHLASLPLSKRPNLATHPVLERLLQLKHALSELESQDLGVEFDDGDSDDDGSDFAYGEMNVQGSDELDEEGDDMELLELAAQIEGLDEATRMQVLKHVSAEQKAKVLRLLEQVSDEEEEDEEDHEGDENFEGMDGLEGELDELEEEAEATPPPPPSKKAKKTKKASSVAVPVLEEPTPFFSHASSSTFSSSSATPSTSTSSASSARKPRTKKGRAASGDSDVLLEPTSLTTADDAEKAAARHSLRFHTTKLNQLAARRTSARAGRMGGDEDIPYRNKQAGRDAALRKNAPKGDAGDDLDGEEYGEADHATARKVRGEAMSGEEAAAAQAEEGDDGYYQLVKKRKREAKEEKQESYDEARNAQRITEDSSGAAGPRGLTRAILKNKGLTPHRAKDVRNPRVKKRKRFEKAKRQVGSMQAVYKGGQSALQGSYGGEQTGISQVVKSRKFV